jgi:hypothetical protein
MFQSDRRTFRQFELAAIVSPLNHSPTYNQTQGTNAMPPKTLKLYSSIVRGENQLTEITLFKPNVAAMRSVSLNALLNMQVDAIAEMLPRISDPKLLPVEIEKMDCVDLLQAGVMIASFFLPEPELDGTA